MHWGDEVQWRVDRFGPLVLGIDPDVDHAPEALHGSYFLRNYVEIVLDGAYDRVGFVKFQSAYFEAHGSSGVAALAHGVASARERGLAVIMDAKRGDIGSTAEAYARAYLTPGASDLESDCMTVNPFLGRDTLEPFVARARHHGKGLFVLVKNSNPQSGWLQDQQLSDGFTVSERVAAFVAELAEETAGVTGIGAVGAVVGATYADQGARMRAIMPRSPFLAPGLGAQGGNPKAMARLMTPTGPVLISASRGVAAVEDRGISLSDYRTLVAHRIDDFKAQTMIAA